MRVMLLSFTAIVVIALCSAAVLQHFEEPASKAFSTRGARV